MKLSFGGERILAVMAYPDDAELLCAGTLARANTEGAAVGICVMCRGDKGVGCGGSINRFDEVRRDEAQAAAEVLGAELIWFGAPDGELMDGVGARHKLMEIFRRFRATLVLTQAPEDYHPDHRAASALADAASWFFASQGHVSDSPPLPTAPALWFADTPDMSGCVPEFYIDISAQVEIKKKMLMCHKTQLQRSQDSDFAPLIELMLRSCAARGAQAGVDAAEAFRAYRAFGRLRAW